MEYKRSNTQIFKHSLTSFFSLFLLFFLLSCTSTSSIAQTSSGDKKAIKLFEEAKIYYNKLQLGTAEELLLKALERDPKFIEAQTLLSYVYMDGDKETEAKESLKKAIAINPTAIPNNLFFLGEIEMREGNYQEAQKAYTPLLSLNNVDSRILDQVNKQLDNINFALEAKKNPYPFKPVNMGPNINSEYPEYLPTITVDDKMMMFTRRLPDANSPAGYNEDFYITRKTNKKWNLAANMEKPINTKVNEGAPSLSANGQFMIYAGCEIFGDYGNGQRGKGSCDLFYSALNNRNWTQPINLGGHINTNNWETQPSFSADGKSLYFVRGKRSIKGMQDGDIFVTKLNDDGSWTKPTPLNRNINTSGNEESVLIHPDGKTLYFASNGHIGMGRSDIYVSKLDENGEWGPAINLGYPINTHKSEGSLLVSAKGDLAYFASDREGGYGELDLYQFNLPENFSPTKVVYFTGKIFDKKTKKPLQVMFELIDLETEKTSVVAFSNNTTGEFLVTLPTGKNYALNASKDGYLFYSENFSLENYDSDQPFTQNVPLSPITVGEKIVLKNIFYETAKYDLKKESKVELEKLNSFLTKHNTVSIEISGHTDNVGSAALNQTLSQNRAESVRKYLIDLGIDEKRLVAKGYGSTKPITDNTTEEGRAKNRRTEFEIIGL